MQLAADAFMNQISFIIDLIELRQYPRKIWTVSMYGDKAHKIYMGQLYIKMTPCSFEIWVHIYSCFVNPYTESCVYCCFLLSSSSLKLLDRNWTSPIYLWSHPLDSCVLFSADESISQHSKRKKKREQKNISSELCGLTPSIKWVGHVKYES